MRTEQSDRLNGLQQELGAVILAQRPVGAPVPFEALRERLLRTCQLVHPPSGRLHQLDPPARLPCVMLSGGRGTGKTTVLRQITRRHRGRPFYLDLRRQPDQRALASLGPLKAEAHARPRPTISRCAVLRMESLRPAMEIWDGR